MPSCAKVELVVVEFLKEVHGDYLVRAASRFKSNEAMTVNVAPSGVPAIPFIN
jgi:hypothetical protein